MNKMKCFLSKKMLLAVVVLLSVGYVQAQEAKDIVLLTLDKALEIGTAGFSSTARQYQDLGAGLRERRYGA